MYPFVPCLNFSSSMAFSFTLVLSSEADYNQWRHIFIGYHVDKNFPSMYFISLSFPVPPHHLLKRWDLQQLNVLSLLESVCVSRSFLCTPLYSLFSLFVFVPMVHSTAVLWSRSAHFCNARDQTKPVCTLNQCTTIELHPHSLQIS